MLVTYIHDALVNDNINYNVYCNCRADFITYENGIANGVNATFVNPSDLETYRIRVNAKDIILSTGSITSSNLLQKSIIGGEKVGKGLALHPVPFVMRLFERNSW
jgi:choline dehydrogenase-like flavoprotein